MADYKPGDLLVGIVDFFAILLPGAMLAVVGLRFEKGIFNGSILPVLADGPPRWIAFVLASYLVGNIVFLIGASILDAIYGTTYRRYKSKQTGDLLYKRVKELKKATLLEHDGIENQFKWSRAIVRIKNSAAAVEIDRLEASSKFFRSLVVVLFIYLFILAYGKPFWPLLLSLVTLLFAYVCYYAPNTEEHEAKSDVTHKLSLFGRFDRILKSLQSIKLLTRTTALLLVVTMTVMAYWKRSEWLSSAICLAMLFLSYWCFVSQRWKMTQAAYLYFVLFSYFPEESKKKDN